MILLLKARVEGHYRTQNGKSVYVQPYYDQRRGKGAVAGQGDLFGAQHPPGTAPVLHQLPPPPPLPPQHLHIRPTAPTAPIEGGPDLASYDRVLIMFSGGKDSIAAVIALLEAGVDPKRIELWHHDIDGGGRNLMDWPVTPAYCRAFANAVGVPIYFSHREGGFEREMTRNNTDTARVVFDNPDGSKGTAGGNSGKLGTREKFPQVSADLSVRWCSGSLKVDVGAAAMRNQDRFKGKRTLVVTGERAQESSNRAKYKTFEPDRTHTQSRHVDHYRPVHGWSEGEVWDAMKRHGIEPHPAYQLGYGRLSCRNCIFGNADQWATNQALYPESTQLVADYEKQFNTTIKRGETVLQQAARGTPYPAAIANPELARIADGKEYNLPILVHPADWKMPAGAFKGEAGPT